MKQIKRLIALVLCAGLVLCTSMSTASAISTSATSTCVIDVDSGRILYEDNAHAQRPIASITKIMTGLLACEASDKIGLDTELTCSAKAAGESGSSMNLSEGDKVSLRSCIYGTMLPSGNDAAMVLAESVGGDLDSFIDMMNDKAQDIGMTETVYGNPNGLIDEGNYSTARDMCLLGRYAIQNDLFREVVSTSSITTDDGYYLENHNRLVRMDDRCLGIKTGWTTAAGRTLVSCFVDWDSGQKVVVCTLNDRDDFNDHIRMANWSFANYPKRTLCTKDKVVTTLTMAGDGKVYDLKASKTLTYPMRDRDTRRLKVHLELPDNQVELKEGEKAGEVVYLLKGKKIASADLIVAAHEEQ